MFGFFGTPQCLKDIRAKMGNMKTGDTAMMRSWSDKPENDFTVILAKGMLDPRKAQDIQDILAGKSTAHLKPGKRKGNRLFEVVE